MSEVLRSEQPHRTFEDVRETWNKGGKLYYHAEDGWYEVRIMDIPNGEGKIRVARPGKEHFVDREVFVQMQEQAIRENVASALEAGWNAYDGQFPRKRK